LEKRGRWDEAIALFKKVLPNTDAQREAAWTWPAPFTAAIAEPATRGIILGVDLTRSASRRAFLVRENPSLHAKRVIYGERSGKNTLLHIVEPLRHIAHSVELPDDKVTLTGGILATDRLTIVSIAGRWYAIGADGSVWWHMICPWKLRSWVQHRTRSMHILPHNTG